MSYINSSGRRNRTLHLYEGTATNLLVFGFSRANAETSHSMRVGAGGCRNVMGSEIFRGSKTPKTLSAVLIATLRRAFTSAHPLLVETSL